MDGQMEKMGSSGPGPDLGQGPEVDWAVARGRLRAV